MHTHLSCSFAQRKSATSYSTRSAVGSQTRSGRAVRYHLDLAYTKPAHSTASPRHVPSVALAKWFNAWLGEDLFWCLGPLERLAAFVPGIDEDPDRLDKVGDAGGSIPAPVSGIVERSGVLGRSCYHSSLVADGVQRGLAGGRPGCLPLGVGSLVVHLGSVKRGVNERELASWPQARQTTTGCRSAPQVCWKTTGGWSARCRSPQSMSISSTGLSSRPAAVSR